MNFLSKLSLTPYLAQLSVNGRWENAFKIDLTKRPLQIPAESKMLGVNKSIAFEIFYRFSDARRLFAGFRFGDTLSEATSPREFVDKFLITLQDVATETFENGAKLIGSSLNGNPETYFATNPDYLELGVADYWKSLGSCETWRKGEPSVSKTTLNTKLASKGHLKANEKNYIALELAFEQPEAWLGIEVSKLGSEPYTLDKDYLIELANKVAPAVV